MPSTTVSILKFVGTISLGILTGTALSATTLLPTHILGLPSAPLAACSFKSISTSTSLHLNILTAISAGAYTLAFLLTPKTQGKHPYLIFTSLVVSLAAGVDSLVALRGSRVPAKVADKEEEEFVDISGRSGFLPSGGVNGEEVRKEVEGYRLRMGARGLVTGLGFAMGVVGIWGDARRI